MALIYRDSIEHQDVQNKDVLKDVFMVLIPSSSVKMSG
jgi:hypothetical protein